MDSLANAAAQALARGDPLAALQRVAYMMDAQHIDASPILDVGTLDRSGAHDAQD